MIGISSNFVMFKSITFSFLFVLYSLLFDTRKTGKHDITVLKNHEGCHNSFDSSWHFKNSLSLFVLSLTAFLELSVPFYLSVFVSIYPFSFICSFVHSKFLTLLLFFLFSSLEEEVENFDVSSLQEEALRNIEADSFWCMSKLLDGIQVSMCLCLCLTDKLLYKLCHFEAKYLNLFTVFHQWPCCTTGLFCEDASVWLG